MFSLFKKAPPKPTRREEIIAKAKANAKAASEAIGEETLQRIRYHMMQKENSPMEQAKKKIMAMDRDRIIDNIRAIQRGEI